MSLTSPARDVLDRSHATIPLSAEDAEVLAELRIQAARFFTQDEATKIRQGSDDFNFGYRPYGRQYSVSHDRPWFQVWLFLRLCHGRSANRARPIVAASADWRRRRSGSSAMEFQISGPARRSSIWSLGWAEA